MKGSMKEILILMVVLVVACPLILMAPEKKDKPKLDVDQVVMRVDKNLHQAIAQLRKEQLYLAADSLRNASKAIRQAINIGGSEVANLLAGFQARIDSQADELEAFIEREVKQVVAVRGEFGGKLQLKLRIAAIRDALSKEEFKQAKLHLAKLMVGIESKGEKEMGKEKEKAEVAEEEDKGIKLQKQGANVMKMLDKAIARKAAGKPAEFDKSLFEEFIKQLPL